MGKSKGNEPYKATSYSLTLNNYGDHPNEWHKALPKGLSYFAYSYEVGKEKKTPHLQGYCQTIHGKSFNTIKRILGPSWHIEASGGNTEQNLRYCTKEPDAEIQHWGECREYAGLRVNVDGTKVEKKTWFQAFVEFIRFQPDEFGSFKVELEELEKRICLGDPKKSKKAYREWIQEQANWYLDIKEVLLNPTQIASLHYYEQSVRQSMGVLEYL